VAYNLGWKLGLAPTGRASAAVLDSYHFERHRAGKDMLVLNEYLHRVELGGESDLPLTEAVRRRLAVILGGQDVVQQRMRGGGA
jgi:2-polyprenyl-6-methoxyphenol hydroxylase-like FAD-dependent oxidoreductase